MNNQIEIIRHFLKGKKTKTTAVAMALIGGAQLLGVDLSSMGFDGANAGTLMLEGLAAFFLRDGMDTAAGA